MMGLMSATTAAPSRPSTPTLFPTFNSEKVPVEHPLCKASTLVLTRRMLDLVPVAGDLATALVVETA